MKKLLTIGNYHISNFLRENEKPPKKKYSLDLILDEENNSVRLKEIAPPESMYGKYWYRSGTNASMTNQLKNVVDEIIKNISYKQDDIWLDVACNDGTLLKFVPKEFIKLGIDPADNSYYEQSSKIANKVVQDFFSKEAFEKTGFGYKKCKIITIIAMFYDLEDPQKIIKDLYEIIDDDGILVLQMSYTPLMIEQLAFDNICHEHIYYYSLTSIKNLFEKNKFKIVNCDLNETNGGSFRVFLQKEKSKINSFGNAAFRDVCNIRTESILQLEKNKYNITDKKIWKDFATRLDELKVELTSFIKTEKAKGKKIYGYGASTKGNTLLQFFNLDSSLITAIAERSPYKYGLKTIGTNIPIISEEQMRKENPDYLLILPWHFIDEFKKRENNFLKNGGKFIVPCPEFKIISYEE